MAVLIPLLTIVMLAGLAAVALGSYIGRPVRYPRHRREPLATDMLHTLYELNRSADETRRLIRDLRRSRRN